MAALLLSAACSSSGGGGGNTNSGAPASAGSGSAGSSAAQAAVLAAEKVPTSVPITTPLTSKPQAGKTFVWLQCEVSQCKDVGDGLKAATAAVGWNLKIINFQLANPATLVSAMQQALQDNPVAVSFDGLPQAVWQSEISAYQKANVPIIAGFVGPQTLSKTVIANVAGPTYYGATGTAIANWVAADSGGKGKVLLYNVPDLPILDAFSTAFKSQIASACSGCSVTGLKGSVAQASGGQANSAIVSALQRDPSVHYLAVDNGQWIGGLPAALSAAGLKVKIVGASGTVENLTAVKNGTESAFTGVALHYAGWAMIDAALRHTENMAPIGSGEYGLPLQLLTKQTSFTVANSFDQPATYQTQLKALWKVG